MQEVLGMLWRCLDCMRGRQPRIGDWTAVRGKTLATGEALKALENCKLLVIKFVFGSFVDCSEIGHC